MNNISIFYTTTLGIEVAIFSIITAVIFIFMQLVYLNYSYKHLKSIFITPTFISFFIISIITFVFTLSGFLSIFLNPKNKIQIFFTNIYVFIGILFLIVCSIAIFFLFVYRKFKFLQPVKALLFSGKNITFSDLRIFLFKKYGIKSPEDLSFVEILENYKTKDSISSQNIIDNSNDNNVGKLTIEIKNFKEKDPNYKIYLKRYKKLKEKSESAFNPVEPINDIIFKSIIKLDIKTVTESRNIICTIIKNFMKDAPKINDEEIWNPDNELINHFTDFILEGIETQLEICESQKIYSLKTEIIEISKCLYIEAINNKNLVGLPNLFTFWKKIADDSINNNKKLFKIIIYFYKDCCERLFENYDENERFVENIFRDVGWIGERLLIKKDFEVKPLMMDLDYYNEYDELLELLISFEDKYKEHSSSYPLIYFDAIDVTYLRLIEIFVKNTENFDIKDNLFSLSYVYFSFGLEAMKTGNSRGAGLAAIRLYDNFKKLKDKNLNNEAKDIIKLLINFGAYSFDYQESLESVDFLGETIGEFLINKISIEDDFITEISSELKEIIIKSYDFKNKKSAWDFIKNLGKKMSTNFNFRFDFNTGEDYK